MDVSFGRIPLDKSNRSSKTGCADLGLTKHLGGFRGLPAWCLPGSPSCPKPQKVFPVIPYASSVPFADVIGGHSSIPCQFPLVHVPGRGLPATISFLELLHALTNASLSILSRKNVVISICRFARIARCRTHLPCDLDPAAVTSAGLNFTALTSFDLMASPPVSC